MHHRHVVTMFHTVWLRNKLSKILYLEQMKSSKEKIYSDEIFVFVRTSECCSERQTSISDATFSSDRWQIGLRKKEIG